MIIIKKYFKVKNVKRCACSGFFILGMLFCFVFSVFGQDQIIKLKDGNVLRGKIVSREKDVYQIETTSLGVFFIHQSDVLSIEEATSVPSAQSSSQTSVGPSSAPSLQSPAQPSAQSTSVPSLQSPAQPSAQSTSVPSSQSPAQPSAPPDFEVYKKKLANDPQIMASVVSLSQDQTTVDLFSDPALKDAIMRQDINYLKNNEKFLKFVNHPTVQRIMGELAAKNDTKN